MTRLEFHFDFGSPNAYLSHKVIPEIEKRTGCAAGFVETDLVDPRYFSAANVKNRIESYLQMIEQRRRGVHVSAAAPKHLPVIGATGGMV